MTTFAPASGHLAGRPRAFSRFRTRLVGCALLALVAAPAFAQQSAPAMAESGSLAAASVTPPADHDDPGPTVASTQVVPPLALTWIFSPAAKAPVNVPLTVCDGTLVMKSPAVPVSALSAVTVAIALGPLVCSV